MVKKLKNTLKISVLVLGCMVIFYSLSKMLPGLEEKVDIANLKSFIAVKNQKKYQIKKKNYIVVLPSAGCPKCESFLNILNGTSYAERLSVFLPQPSKAVYNKIKKKYLHKAYEISIYIPAGNADVLSLFTYGALIIQSSQTEIINIERITDVDMFTKRHIEEVFRKGEK